MHCPPDGSCRAETANLGAVLGGAGPLPVTAGPAVGFMPPPSPRLRWTEHVTPFMAFPPEVRRVVYTKNAIEALNRQLRKAVETKGHFPGEDAARKLLYLAIHNAVPQWTRTRGWTKAVLAFKTHFGDRLPD